MTKVYSKNTVIFTSTGDDISTKKLLAILLYIDIVVFNLLTLCPFRNFDFVLGPIDGAHQDENMLQMAIMELWESSGSLQIAFKGLIFC